MLRLVLGSPAGGLSIMFRTADSFINASVALPTVAYAGAVVATAKVIRLLACYGVDCALSAMSSYDE